MGPTSKKGGKGRGWMEEEERRALLQRKGMGREGRVKERMERKGKKGMKGKGLPKVG